MKKHQPSGRVNHPLTPNPSLVDTIEEHIKTHYEPRRRPVVAAGVLAIITELYLRDRNAPFPQRREVAEALNCSVFGVDAAISVALARNMLSARMRMVPGNVEQRESVVKHRIYVPAPELIDLAKKRAISVAA